MRNDVKIPYDIDEYSKFKLETKNIADKYYVNFVSLEKIIPSKLWGFKGSTKFKKKSRIRFYAF